MKPDAPQPLERKILSELKVRHLANLFVVASVFVVLGTTLYPFDFTTNEIAERLAPFIKQDFNNLRSVKDDILTNIVLFFPIGISFGILATRRRMSALRGLLLVTLAGGALSLTVEVLQLFLPFRYSSFVDVASNSMGTSVGFLFYRGVGRYAYGLLTAAIERANNGNAVGWLAFAYMLYLFCIILGSVPFQESSSMREFNKSTYPLLVGNEPTGNRQWVGAIKELVIAKYPFSDEGISEFLDGRELNTEDHGNIVAHYLFTGEAPYRDLRGLHAPLEWKGKNPDSGRSDEANILPKTWLQTNKEAYELSSWIMETLRFTICLDVASRGPNSADFSRIVSVSSDPYHRNFSVVQIGTDLAVRFRSMTTGINGTNPQFVVANVFTDTLMHRIVVTLTPSQLQVFVDNPDRHYEIELGPGFSLLNKFFPSNGKLYISSAMKNFHRVLFAFIVFVPLGYLVAVLASELQTQVLLRIAIVCIGIAVPPLLLERMLCIVADRSINMQNLMVGLGIMFGTVVITLSSRLYRSRSSANTVEVS